MILGVVFGGIFKRDVYQPCAKSSVCREKPPRWLPLNFALPIGVESGLLLRSRWSAFGTDPSAELFRDDACASCRNGFAVWIGTGGDRQRFSLEFWLDQHAHPFSASSRWNSRRGVRMLASPESSCEQAEDGGCHGGDICGVATRMDRGPLNGRETRRRRRRDGCTGRYRPCALANPISQSRS